MGGADPPAFVYPYNGRGLAPVIKEHPSSITALRNDPVTLNCAASGASRITWFRDGLQVITSSQDSRSHRVLLPSGSLFFLRVASNRRETDAGTYWCVASNSYGTRRSKNATLSIAYLSYEFEAHPEPVVKAHLGDSIEIPCKPPKGSPEPDTQWIKNGLELSNSSRVYVFDKEGLIIKNVTSEDSASYVCRARNVAGTRETRPTELVILIPPSLEKKPENVTTASGSMVDLICHAQGSPKPSVTWRRLDGIMPLGRVTIEDQRLILEHVTAVDSGVYSCEVRNEAGIASAEATLTVVDRPEIMQRLQDVQVMAGKDAFLTCIVEGVPPPLILWRLPTQDRTALLTSSHKNGHVYISQDGQMMHLESVTTEDSGIYHCWGVSRGGGVSTQAEVLVVEAYPPPVIGNGLKDLNLIPGSIAVFPCEVISEYATPSIKWSFRPAAHLPARPLLDRIDGRVTLSAAGTLSVKDVRIDDTGIYTCNVSAETGNVEQVTILRVTKEATKALAVTEPLLTPPSKPQIMIVNETTVTLNCTPNSQTSHNTGQRFIIEYWRQGWDEWRMAETAMMKELCIIKNLMPGNTYFFLVRTITKKGTSFPSPWSDPVAIRSPRDPSLTVDQVRHAQHRLSRSTVTLTKATATGPNSVLLNWRFLATAHEAVEGILVYTITKDNDVQVTTVFGSFASSHHLVNIQPSTHYIFFIVPFWRSVEGTPSNSYSITTPEDTPLISPHDIHAVPRDDGSILITWSNLSLSEARGNVTGYQVNLSYNGTETTEVVSSPWLEVHGHAPSRIYAVKVAAETKAGLGPYSAPVSIDFGLIYAQGHHGNSKGIMIDSSVLYAPPQPAWLVYVLVPLVILLFVATMIYIKRLHHKSSSLDATHNTTHSQDPAVNPPHDSISMYSEQKQWHPRDCERECRQSYMHLLRADHQNSIMHKEPQSRANESPEPYATTALLAPASPHSVHESPWHRRRDKSRLKVDWTAFLPPLPASPPPCDNAFGDSTQNHKGFGIKSWFDDARSSGEYKNPCEVSSEPNSDTYSPVCAKNSLNCFLKFNSSQGKNTCKEISEDGQANHVDLPLNLSNHVQN
ncbi:Roundabout 1 [Halocaridina rubra]|uniref:Roundabout 1 n=1 Tax=Halocaridina rubra TaxID=373956 RepID=A0AAN8ZXN2_HALRR